MIVKNVDTLATLLDQINTLSDDLTLYVADSSVVTAETAALAQPVSQDGTVPAGFRYLLEVSLARETIEVWSDWRNGLEPTSSDKADAVIYYAKNDAYMPLP